MTEPTAADEALDDLHALVAHGPRFHGTTGIAAAADWIEAQLAEHGLTVRREPVTLPGWHPGQTRRVTIGAPQPRDLPAWPMLWSAGGRVSGRLAEIGPEGLWGDSIVWRRFAVQDPDGRALAWLHARDGGPAAPQPLPAGSDPDLPHLAIGHIDGLQLSEWLADGHPVSVEVELDSGPRAASIADNLIVDIPGTGDGLAVVCAHYDTFYNTVGAYDNGSGTVALLALARRWAAQPPARAVRLVWFTAEEWHLGGSRHHVAALDEAQREAIDFVLNLDGLGRGDFLEAFAGPEAFGHEFGRTVLAHAQRTGRGLRLANRFPPTKGTDDASFHAAGIPSAFLTFNDLHRLHQPDDLPNPGIATNVAWSVPLTCEVIDTLARPTRVPPPGML